MTVDFDPLFCTETMVKILRDQGHNLRAIALAEIILKKNPQNESVQKILDEIKEDQRKAFERFRNSGRPERGGSGSAEKSAAVSEEPEPMDEVGGPEEETELKLSLVRGGTPKADAETLKRLLKNAQEYRRKHGTS